MNGQVRRGECEVVVVQHVCVVMGRACGVPCSSSVSMNCSSSGRSTGRPCSSTCREKRKEARGRIGAQRCWK